jgi:ribonuclease HI
MDFCELKSHFKDSVEIYTDGSKDNNKVGCASVSEYHTSKVRLPDSASIFTAEVQAIDLALRFISSFNQKNYIIFSDSLSALQSLQNRDLTNPIVQNVLIKHHNLCASKNIVFCWLPSHVGIRGNELADKEAKLALNLNIAKFKLPFTEFKPQINNYIVSKWQELWDMTPYNKLHLIRPNLGERHSVHRSVRREEVVLARCRIGHSFITHSYLLRKQDKPECVFCVEPLTIEHLLLNCADLIQTRQNYFQCNSMRELFQTVSNDVILSFLKETGLYTKI